jgi:hypothetical protein
VSTQFSDLVIAAAGMKIVGSLDLPSKAVVNGQVADYTLAAIKSDERWIRKTYAQPNVTATTETKVVHGVFGTTGVLSAIKAGSIGVNAGAATVTIDLKKNGTSILSAVITLNNANTARVMVAGTFSATTLAVGDVLELVITATAGGGTLATGVFVELDLYEKTT